MGSQDRYLGKSEVFVRYVAQERRQPIQLTWNQKSSIPMNYLGGSRNSFCQMGGLFEIASSSLGEITKFCIDPFILCEQWLATAKISPFESLLQKSALDSINPDTER
jgi:hypothetical protein